MDLSIGAPGTELAQAWLACRGSVLGGSDAGLPPAGSMPRQRVMLQQPGKPHPAWLQPCMHTPPGSTELAGYLRLWTAGADSDPWPNTTDSGTMLTSFKNYWNANMTVRKSR